MIRIKKIEDLSDETECNNFIYKYDYGNNVNFSEISNTITFLNKIEN